jgi:hypothetical protein
MKGYEGAIVFENPTNPTNPENNSNKKSNINYDALVPFWEQDGIVGWRVDYSRLHPTSVVQRDKNGKIIFLGH